MGREAADRQTHCPAPARPPSPQSWPWAPQHMAGSRSGQHTRLAANGGAGGIWAAACLTAALGNRTELGHPSSTPLLQNRSKADWAGRLEPPVGWVAGWGCPPGVPRGFCSRERNGGQGCTLSLYHPPPRLLAGPSSCCSAGPAPGTAGPGSWAGPWRRAGSHRRHAPRWHPGSARLQARG